MISGDSMLKKSSFPSCERCSGHYCCGKVQIGGVVAPAFLLKSDMLNIINLTGMKIEDFAIRHINHRIGETVYLVKYNDKGCIFLTPEGRCSIYNVRPIDCRLFPFDIKKKGNSYYWVLYQYRNCMPVEHIQSNFEKIEPLLSLLLPDIENYATLESMESIPYFLIQRMPNI